VLTCANACGEQEKAAHQPVDELEDDDDEAGSGAEMDMDSEPECRGSGESSDGGSDHTKSIAMTVG